MCSDRPRVCLVGALARSPAEGMEGVCRALLEGLAPYVEVLPLDGRLLGRGRGWLRAARFRPQIIHYAAGPSNASLVLLESLRRFTRARATLLSAVHPVRLSPVLVRALAPSLVLAQGESSEAFFRGLGVPTRYLPNGVDKSRFRPARPGEALSLRARYGLPEGLLALHVGHLRRGRGLEDLLSLRAAGVQVLVVASPATRPDPGVWRKLVEAGVVVWRRFLTRIEEVYRLADVYVFPTVDPEAAIETPLSVLEAAASGLPIISRRFGALPRLYPEGPSCRYYQDPGELPALVASLVPPGKTLRARTPDWGAIVGEVVRTYRALLWGWG